MRALTRPGEASGWDAKVKQTRQDVAKAVRDGKKPDFEDKEHWRAFKKDFEDVDTKTFRCAYCEISLAADRYKGDVEHYRPKAAAADRQWHLRQGKNVRGIKNKIEPGYYWLAYEWSNLLVACPDCNKKKANFFPLVGVSGPRKLTRGCERNESPLLLNPYDDQSPEEHLAFGTLGDVTAAGAGTNRARGQETIEVCDLDRDELRKERMAIAVRAHQDIKEYLKAALAKNREVVRVLRASLKVAMRADSPFSGVVRIIFYQRTRQHWTTL
jgi:sarcosine oxidase delta subunit